MDLLPIRWTAAGLAAVVALGCVASDASAQVALQSGGTAARIPSPVLNPAQGLTQQQLQSLMLMRAMQSRGGARTGYPQFIPMGNQGFGEQSVYSDGGESTSTRKSSAQRKAEARKTREEQKHAQRDAAGKGKKAKPAKKPKGGDQAAGN